MTIPEAQDARDDQRPQDATPSSPPDPAGPDIPSRRYDATLRLIRSRLADEAKAKPKPWWKLKP